MVVRALGGVVPFLNKYARPWLSENVKVTGGDWCVWLSLLRVVEGNAQMGRRGQFNKIQTKTKELSIHSRQTNSIVSISQQHSQSFKN